MVKTVQSIQMRVETFAHAKEIADYWAILPLTLRDGYVVRYGIYLAAQPVNGYVLILPDRDGFIEHYSEIAEDFASRGWQVWCMEWRGQGRTPQVMDAEEDIEGAILSLDEVGMEINSEQGLDGAKGENIPHGGGGSSPRIEIPDWYEKCVMDIEEFWIRGWLPETRGDPALVITHGHGSHVALRWLIKHKKRKLGKTAFVFAAPDVHPNPAGMPLWMTGWIASFISLFVTMPYLGQSKRLRSNRRFETNLLTTDQVRFGIIHKWYELYPELLPRKFSWGRLGDAIRSGDALRRDLVTGGVSILRHRIDFWGKMWRERADYLSRSGLVQKIKAFKAKKWRIEFANKISPPSLIFLTPKDRMLFAPSQYHLVRRFKKARFVQLDKAKHDIFHESDTLRQQVWREIDRFLYLLYGEGKSATQTGGAAGTATQPPATTDKLETPLQ